MHTLVVPSIELTIAILQCLNTCVDSQSPFSVVTSHGCAVISSDLLTGSLLVAQSKEATKEITHPDSLHVEVVNIIQFKAKLAEIADTIEGFTHVSWHVTEDNHACLLCTRGLRIVITQNLTSENFGQLTLVISDLLVNGGDDKIATEPLSSNQIKVLEDNHTEKSALDIASAEYLNEIQNVDTSETFHDINSAIIDTDTKEVIPPNAAIVSTGTSLLNICIFSYS